MYRITNSYLHIRPSAYFTVPKVKFNKPMKSSFKLKTKTDFLAIVFGAFAIVLSTSVVYILMSLLSQYFIAMP